MHSLCLGLLMGHDTFSRLCLVNLRCDHLWIIGRKLVKSLNCVAKIAVSPNQKSFWKKYHAPLIYMQGQDQHRSIRHIYTKSFSQNLVTTFGYPKSSLYACRWSQPYLKSGNSIRICSFIKAAHGCQTSSPSYHFNILNFDSKKKHPWDLWRTTLMDFFETRTQSAVSHTHHIP